MAPQFQRLTVCIQRFSPIIASLKIDFNYKTLFLRHSAGLTEFFGYNSAEFHSEDHIYAFQEAMTNQRIWDLHKNMGKKLSVFPCRHFVSYHLT